MTDHDLSDLENEDNWDFDAAVVHPPSDTARGVIPVAFEGADFDRLAAYARGRGESLAECIRHVVLRHLDELSPSVEADSAERTHDPLD